MTYNAAKCFFYYAVDGMFNYHGEIIRNIKLNGYSKSKSIAHMKSMLNIKIHNRNTEIKVKTYREIHLE